MVAATVIVTNGPKEIRCPDDRIHFQQVFVALPGKGEYIKGYRNSGPVLAEVRRVVHEEVGGLPGVTVYVELPV